MNSAQAPGCAPQGALPGRAASGGPALLLGTDMMLESESRAGRGDGDASTDGRS